jgi:gamma-glutamyl-gamma-aminobutyrate hydrolase PuuD
LANLTFYTNAPYPPVVDYMKTLGIEKVTKEEARKNSPSFLLLSGNHSICETLYNPSSKTKNAHFIEQDWTDMSTLIAFRLAGIPIIGVNRGLQLLHISFGGALQRPVSYSYAPHGLIECSDNFRTVTDPEGKALSVIGSHYYYVDYSEADEKYEEVFCDTEYQHAEIIYDKSKKCVGFQYNIFEINQTLNKHLFEFSKDLLVSAIKDLK